jgi:hypothetical protein
MIDNFDLDIALIDAPPSVSETSEGLGVDYIAEVLKDYATCVLSREISLIGRREVLSGKGKFGIFGDGKEVPQMAMARTFQKGDWRPWCLDARAIFCSIIRRLRQRPVQWWPSDERAFCNAKCG